MFSFTPLLVGVVRENVKGISREERVKDILSKCATQTISDLPLAQHVETLVPQER